MDSSRAKLRRLLGGLVCAASVAAGALLAAKTDIGRMPRAQAAARPAIEPATSEPEGLAIELRRAPERAHRDAFDPFGATFARGKVITGATPHRLLLFTFDDGPNRRTTPRLLEHLDRYGVHAIFFLTPSRIRGENGRERLQQEIAREILRRGHVVANHTLDHVQLPVLNDVGVAEQIDEADRIFIDVLGQRPWLLRPPGGSRSARVDAMIARRQYTDVLWNLGTGDVQVQTAEEVFETWKRVLEVREREAGERGGIILMHDIHEHSVEAFPLIMDEILRRNCALLERGEELYDVVGDLRYFYERAAPGEPGAEAAPARLTAPELATRQARLRRETAARCDPAR